MECDGAQRLIIAAFEGEPLDKAQEEELKAHLLACPSCLLAYKRYNRLQKGYELLAAEEPPEEFLKAWRAGMHTAKARRLPVRALSIAASFVLLLGIGALAWRASENSSVPSPEAGMAETRRAAIAAPETFTSGAPEAPVGGAPPQTQIAPFSAPSRGIATAQDEADILEENIIAVPDAQEPPEDGAAAPQLDNTVPKARTAAPDAHAAPETDIPAPEAAAGAAAPRALAIPIEGLADAENDEAAPETAEEEAVEEEAVEEESAGALLVSPPPERLQTLKPEAPLPSATPGVLRTNSYTIALSAEDCDAVVGYLSALGKSEAVFERALRTSKSETGASVALNVTPEEQSAFLGYLKDNAYGEAQGAIKLSVKLTVRG